MLPTTLFTGIHHIALDSVGSTNDYAKELNATEKQPDGTLITATAQHSGRGQAGSQWQSEVKKNLIASYIFYPTFLPADRQFALSMVASLAVKEIAEEMTGQEICIKWPNDIYYRHNKVAGILIENTISGSHLSSSIIGIGLNVNQTKFDSVLANPSSLKLISGQEFSINTIINRLSSYMEKYYLQLRKLHYHFLEKGYTESLYLYNQTATFLRDGQAFKGQIVGVTREGKLIIESNGKELKFGMKELSYVIGSNNY